MGILRTKDRCLWLTCNSICSDATQMGKHASAESDEGPLFHIKISSWEFHQFSFYIWLKYVFHTWHVILCQSLCSESFGLPECKSQKLGNLHFSQIPPFLVLKSLVCLFSHRKIKSKAGVNEWTELRSIRYKKYNCFWATKDLCVKCFLPEIQFAAWARPQNALGHIQHRVTLR